MEVLSLVDGHCHRVLGADLDRPAFERACTEADLPPPPEVSYLDGQLGTAVRRWCPPALGLPAHASIDEYLARRAEVGWASATASLLHAAGLGTLLVDTGLDGADLDHLVPVREIVRLERVAEQVAFTEAAGFADAFADALAERLRDAVGVKSIIGYRYGLAIPPERPSAAEVARAAGEWLRVGGRLTDPVLLRHVLWAGIDAGLPLQLHTGFGDRDIALSRADPALAQPFLDATVSTGVPIVLLHCYPYHRSAGWLANVYPHVYVDLGLTVSHLGGRSSAVLGEYFELTPFGKLLFSTDAYLLPELYLVGAAQFRHSLRRLVDDWLADGAMTAADAERIALGVGATNAQRVYALAATSNGHQAAR